MQWAMGNSRDEGLSILLQPYGGARLTLLDLDRSRLKNYLYLTR